MIHVLYSYVVFTVCALLLKKAAEQPSPATVATDETEADVSTVNNKETDKVC